MSNKWVSIGVWGDSIVHGGCDPVLGGWVNRLRLYLWGRGLGDHVFNLGLGGNNSTQVLARIGAELRARVGHLDHVLVSVGVNDLLHPTAPVLPPEFEANLRAIVAEARAQGKPPHLLSMISIQREPEKCAVYNAVIEQVAAETGAGFVDLRHCVDAVDMPDGVHPDGAGHEKMFQTVKAHLIRTGLVPAE